MQAVQLAPEVAEALRERRPVVALESTLIAHGLPWPVNLETATGAEALIRKEGALPATIAVCAGQPTVGLSSAQLEHLASACDVRKATRRDIAAAVAQNAWAATTVAATMALAHIAGVRVFATGGIGGVHRRAQEVEAPDVSADLHELARTPVIVVCAGAKSILDLPGTVELLETLSVPVIGFQTSTFPAFYVAFSGLPVSSTAQGPDEVARMARAHWALGGAGIVVAQPVPVADAIGADELGAALTRAEADAARDQVRGPSLTPFLLRRLAEITQGRSLRANRALVLSNACLAARIACALEAD